ncbi:MAG: hypothetical protein AAF152_19410, partial [Cyanobacteria bacterium P01_A01_bin.114]
YWLLFAWLSSTTISSVADSVWGTAVSGGRRLVSALRQTIRADEEPLPENQSTLQHLAAEVSQLAEQQLLLPQLLDKQTETLLTEISELKAFEPDISELNMAELTHQPASSSAPVPQELPAPDLPDLSGASTASSSLLSQLPSWREMLRRALDQVDLSDVDIETLWHQLRSDDSQIGQDAILRDAETYLRQTPVWILESDLLNQAFYDRLYDPEAAPEQIKAQLAQIDRTDFTRWLQGRGDLATDRVEAVAEQLSQIQQSVVATLSSGFSPGLPSALSSDLSPEQSTQTADVEALSQIQEKLVAYCRYTSLDLLTPEGLVEKVQSQFQAHSLPVGHDVRAHLDLDAIAATLSRRQGMASAHQQALLEALHSTLPEKQLDNSHQSNGSLQAPRRWAVRAGHSAQGLTDQLKTQIICYLQHQDKSAFQPAQIAQDLTRLVKSTLSDLSLGDSLSDLDLPDGSQLASLFDQAAWRQALEKRRDMTADEIQQILAWGESAWQQATQQVSHWLKAFWSEAQALLKPEDSSLLEMAQHQVVDRLAAAQEALEDQAASVKADLQAQTDAARGQVAIAAWWLFISLLSSGGSAAIAGWLASTY